MSGHPGGISGRRRESGVLRCVWLLAALLVFAAPLRAQVIRGTVTERETGRPIVGAVVVLLDAAQRPLDRVFSDTLGGFLLRAPAAGRYRLRADRIGYESLTSAPLTTDGVHARDVRLEVPVRAVSLERIMVTAGKRCLTRAQEDRADVERVWEEARKALAATTLTQSGRLYRFDLELYTRSTTPDGSEVLDEQTRRVPDQASAQPFTSLPAEDLSAHGYVRPAPGTSYDFFAPDAQVLLSDAFLDTHCLRLAEGTGDAAGLIGLEFQPIHGRDVADIRGTFWLDRATAALRFLEFGYTGLGPSIPVEGAGGRVEFAPLPGGAWYVRRWWIRMPLVARGQLRLFPRAGGERTVVKVREQGGEVERIRPPRAMGAH